MAVRKPRHLPIDSAPDDPALKEFTISMGDADLYVNMDRHLDLDDRSVLYEAILTDELGSRTIYVDRDDLEDCLLRSPIITHHDPEVLDGPEDEREHSRP